MPIKELLIYCFVATSSMVLMSFVAHMMVGGLVSPRTEMFVQFGLCATIASLIAFMAWDVAKRRKRK